VSAEAAYQASPADAGGRTSLDLLVDEASRQLTICNSCRYCEGLCAVFPAMERRTVFGTADISQLANLCHDCRACYDACMYTPPHEFAMNVPRVLAAVRLEDYRRYVWPARPPRLLRGWTGIFSGAIIASALVLLVAVINVGGLSGLTVSGKGASSPYELIPYGVLLVLLFLPSVFSVVVIGFAARKYWRETGTAAHHQGLTRAVGRAIAQAATLRYLRGGGGDCYYPEKEKPSPDRRRLHALVAYGFGLCLVSTIAAAIMQDFMGIDPPYPVISVPVIAGLTGGVGLLVGCVGLLLLKTRAAAVTSVSDMTIKDYGLLSGLAFLALSGLATFLVRSTPAFGPVFLVHMAAVMVSFASAPYSKFVHLVYRFLALVRDNLEVGAGAAPPL
jgi:citrate/tricarballylate utilization protein